MLSISKGLGDFRTAADGLRELAIELFGAERGSGVVLIPGVLNALRMLFCCLGVERLLLSDEEYYDAAHFPGMRTTVAPVSSMPKIVKQESFDAIVLSVVSWRGRKISSGALRKAASESAWRPLMILDYSHAGAAGFPAIEGLPADVVIGDFQKWVLEDWTPRNVGFLIASARAMKRSINNAFRPYFLATNGPQLPRSARWIDPDEILFMHDYLTRQNVTRSKLLETYRDNLAMATRFGATLSPPVKPRTSILTGRRSLFPHELISDLSVADLAYFFEDQVRLLCDARLIAGCALNHKILGRNKIVLKRSQ